MARVLYPVHIDRWKNPIATVLREIATRSTDLDVFSFSGPHSEEDRTLGAAFWGLPHVRRTLPRDLALQRFDIVHQASATGRNLAAALLCRLRNPGRCIHILTAGSQPTPISGYYRHYLLAARLAHVVVAVSQVVARDIAALAGRPVDAVIPNGVDLRFFDPAAAVPCADSLPGPAQPYVLFVGVLTRSKRPDMVIQIAALLPQVRFVLAGGAYSPHEREHFVRLAAQHPNVNYLGPQPRARIRDLMAGALALVFPSEREGLPLTVLEALAMGLPVLAQPRSSLPELVRPGLTGWLLPDTYPEQWAAHIVEVLGWSTAERQAFARRARQLVARHFSWHSVAEQYQALYQAALQRRNGT